MSAGIAVTQFDAPEIRTLQSLDPTSDARRLLLSVMLNAVVFAIALSTTTIGFESNDDIGMARIASGALTGKPVEEIVFSHFLIGRALKSLYQWSDRWTWYTFYLIGVHFATLTGLLYAFLRVQKGRLALWLFLILFAQFEVAVLLLLQFTSVAAMASVSGVVLILSSTRRRESSRLAIVYGGCLIVLAGMIRGESMYYAIALLSPLLAFELFLHRVWKQLAILGAFVLVAQAANLGNSRHYLNDPRWRDFKEYNDVRSSMHDLPIIEFEPNTRFFFDRAGWSYTDWGMFNSWFFTDPDTFSYEHLRQLLDRFQGASRGRSDWKSFLAEHLERVAVFRFLMYANAVLAVFLCRGARLRLFLLGVAQCLVAESLLTLFAVYAKLPPRVLLPAFYATSVAVFFGVLRVADERRFAIVQAPSWGRRRLSAVAGVVFAACYGVICFQTCRFHLTESELNRHKQDVFHAYVRTVVDRCAKPHPGAIFVNWGATFPIDFAPPFDNLRELRTVNAIDLGWYTHSPPFQDWLRQEKVADLYRAIYEDPQIYFCTSPTYVKHLRRFVQEHYRKSIIQNRDDAYVVDRDYPPPRRGVVLEIRQVTLEGAQPPQNCSAPPVAPPAAPSKRNET